METINKPTLYIIQGFIASGKSTYSKKLSKETGAIHLNPDEWVTNIFPEQDYMSDWDNCFNKTLKILWSKAQEYLRNGKDVIFDMGFWLKKDRDYAKDIAIKCGAEFKHIYLFVPDEILKQRIINTRPQKWVKIHLENFDKNKKLFELPDNDERYVMINNY